MPVPAAAAHLAGGTGEAGRAHVLNADDRAGLHGFEAGFEQQLLHERIAHLHVRTLLLGFLGELGRRHGCAVDAVAPGLRADVDHRIAGPFRLAVEDLAVLEDAEREDVHQRIAVVAFFEDALAADRRDAEAVAVMRDAGDHAFQDAGIPRSGFRVLEGTEAQRIQHRDRPRAHGENVAQDAADAGGRALKRLDEAGMVVRLDLEGDAVAVADIDDAGVFARALQDPACRAWAASSDAGASSCRSSARSTSRRRCRARCRWVRGRGWRRFCRTLPA